MIPRHSLPYGIGEFAAQVLTTSAAPSVTEVEQAFANSLRAPAVLLFPSARAAIYTVIRAACGPQASVSSPAYTCSVVHEALALAGAENHMIDSAKDSFLMPTDAIARGLKHHGALLVSEVYGLAYDVAELDRACAVGCRLRVFDMAMSIPSAERIRLLQNRDVALYSFGWGKPLYAGWGSIACFQDPGLAEEVRRTRTESMSRMSSRTASQDAAVFLQVVLNERIPNYLLHERHLYAFWRTLRDVVGRLRGVAGAATKVGASSRQLPASWSRPPTALNRRLALWSLRDSAANSEIRLSQAKAYWEMLVDSGLLAAPGGDGLPQSHFPIRVPTSIRDRLRDNLRRRGIDTGVLFPLADSVSRSSYPHAAQAADEVINLPLGPTLSLGEVHLVADRVAEGLRRLRGDSA